MLNEYMYICQETLIAGASVDFETLIYCRRDFNSVSLQWPQHISRLTTSEQVLTSESAKTRSRVLIWRVSFWLPKLLTFFLHQNESPASSEFILPVKKRSVQTYKIYWSNTRKEAFVLRSLLFSEAGSCGLIDKPVGDLSFPTMHPMVPCYPRIDHLSLPMNKDDRSRTN